MNEAIISMGIGIVLGGAIGIINTIITNSANIKLERLKMHGGAKIEAYKNLFIFSETILKNCAPDEDMVRGFLDVMRNKFGQKIFPNYMYYSKKIRDLLAKFKNHYDYWNHPDFFDEEKGRKFISDELLPLALKLQELSIKEACV